MAAAHPHADRCRFTPEDIAAVQGYLEDEQAPNSFFGRDAPLRRLEDELAAYFSRRYCILTNSGTSALFSTFAALPIKPGDEVIGPVYTFHATVTPLLQLGVVPVLADVDPVTGVIEAGSVERNITDRTVAIVATHQWGHPFDADVLPALARRHSLPLVEDVSLAVGATTRGRKAGALGDVAALSLGSTKLLSGGQGGALLCDDDEIYERATLVGHFGLRALQTVLDPRLRPFAATGFGHNLRIHPLAAAISRCRLQRADSMIKERKERFDLLSGYLSSTEVFRPPRTAAWATRGAWQGYVAHYEDASGVPLRRVAEALSAEGMEVTAGGYQPPLHLQPALAAGVDPLGRPAFSGFGWRKYQPGDFPGAEKFVENAIGFPLFLDEPVELIQKYGLACQKVAQRISDLRE